MAQLTIDLSGRGGLAPRYFGDLGQSTSAPERRYLGQEGSMAEGKFNPFTRYGYLSGAVDTLGATTFDNATAALLASVIYDPVNNDYYLAERGQQIYRGDGFDDTSHTRVLDLGSTGTPVIHDLEIYQVNGVRKLFFVYETSGNLQVGISDLPYNTVSDDLTWLTSTVSGFFTNSTSSNYNFLRVADNGFAYLFADNTVHKIDGTSNGGSNGTVSPNVLLFPPFFRINDAIDYRGLMFIVVQQTTFDATTSQSNSSSFETPSGVYIWDRLSSVVQTRDYVPLKGIKAIKHIYIAPNGSLRIMCVGDNRLGQIREYDGSNFKIIQEMGLNSLPRYRDGLTSASGLTIWLGEDGNMYAHGNTVPGEKEILAIIGTLGVANIDFNEFNTGAILHGSGNSFSDLDKSFTVCYFDTLNYVAKKWFPFDKGTINNNAQQNHQGDVYTLVKHLPQMTTVHNIELYHVRGSLTGTTVQATIKIYLNGSTSVLMSKNITRDDVARGYKRIEINKPFVNSIQLEIEFADNITTSDSYDYHPSFCVVNFQDTDTKG